MPRYFFEVETEEALYQDQHGSVYPTDEAALRSGQRLATELMDEGARFAGSIMKVLNEHRSQIGEFTIRPSDEKLQ